jgi:ElaB/YqjD/DUF883 family membrane-anchored ribosome-binding protein
MDNRNQNDSSSRSSGQNNYSSDSRDNSRQGDYSNMPGSRRANNDRNYNRDNNASQTYRQNDSQSNNQTPNRDRRDLSDKISAQMDKIDQKLSEAKQDVKDESRRDRKKREDMVKDLQDKRSQLSDAYYKVQRATVNTFDDVKKETSKVVDDIGDWFSKTADKVTK